jgi:hypothetical protein
VIPNDVKLKATYWKRWNSGGLNYHEEWTDESKEFGHFSFEK